MFLESLNQREIVCKVAFEAHNKSREMQMVMGVACILDELRIRVSGGKLVDFSPKSDYIRFSLGVGGTGIGRDGEEYVSISSN